MARRNSETAPSPCITRSRSSSVTPRARACPPGAVRCEATGQQAGRSLALANQGDTAPEPSDGCKCDPSGKDFRDLPAKPSTAVRAGTRPYPFARPVRPTPAWGQGPRADAPELQRRCWLMHRRKSCAPPLVSGRTGPRPSPPIAPRWQAPGCNIRASSTRPNPSSGST